MRLSFFVRTGTAVTLTAALASSTLASATKLRIASYNIEADINGVTAPRSGLSAVLEQIGATTVQGNAQPLDIVGLEETTSESATVAPIAASLNSYYGSAANYATTGVQGGEVSNDPTTGNGPNSLIYNTKTLKLLAATPVGSASGSSNGVYRQIMRYEFEPVTGSMRDAFYMYVEHYKSGTGTSNVSARALEAQYVRNTEIALPTTAHLIYSGDLNMSPGETGYNTLTSSTATAQGQAIDPLGNGNYKAIYTDSSTSLKYRDDYLLNTQPMVSDTTGTTYVTNSYTTLGNNGGSLTGAGSLPASTLSSASDHLPVFADYNYVLDPTADFNDDGQVDIADLGILATNYGMSGTKLTGDANGDGVVNIADLGLLATNYGVGTTGPQLSFAQALAEVGLPSVPEPTALAMIAAATPMLIGRRRC